METFKIVREREVWVELSKLYSDYLVVQCLEPHFQQRFSTHINKYNIFENPLKLKEFQRVLEAHGYRFIFKTDIDRYLTNFHKLTESIECSLFYSDLGLYPFQIIGINKALGVNDILLIWPTGSGKTVGGIALAAKLIELNKIDKVIVFCKRTKKTDWYNDFKKFTPIETEIIEGNADYRKTRWEVSKAKVLITNYEKLNLEYNIILQTCSSCRTLVIYDEVQKLRNRRTILHKTFARFLEAGGADKQLALSATPIEHSPVDYYNLFRLFKKDIFGSVKEWEEEYVAGRIGRDKKFYPFLNCFGNYTGFKNISKMKYKTHFMTHIVDESELKEYFPEPVNIPISLELSSQDRILYDSVLKKTQAEFKDLSQAQKYSRFNILRLICNTPEALHYSNVRLAQELVKKHTFTSDFSIKLQRTGDLLENILTQGDKAVIFTMWTNTTMFVIAPHLRKRFRNTEFILYHGGMSDKSLEKAKNKFKQNKHPCILLSSDAGAEGLNLQEARYVINYDLPWKWTTIKQRGERINRIDSTFDATFVYTYITKNTVEEAVETKIYKKHSYHQAIVQNTSQEIKREAKLSSSLLHELLMFRS